MIRTKSIFEKKSESDGARICVMRWVKQSYNQGGGARVMNEILFKQEMMRAVGTDAEHEKWLSLYDDSDQGGREKGLGYRHGLTKDRYLVERTIARKMRGIVPRVPVIHTGKIVRIILYNLTCRLK